MKTDRLRFLSIGVIAVAVVALAGEIFTHSASHSGFVITLVLLGVALEKIRLEFRDIREELRKKTSPAEVLSTPHI